MRRVKLKVAPNLGSISRLSKVSTANVVVDKSQEDATPTLNVETNVTQESSSILPNLVTNNAGTIPEISASINTCSNPEQSTVFPPVVGIAPSFVDKENIQTVSDETTRDSQTSASVNEPSVPSLSRYKARNKVQPVISNASHRVRTFSSASESEDDATKRNARTPLSPVKKSPAKKENVDSTPSLSVLPQKTTTEKGKRGKKKSDEKIALEMKKAVMRRKFANGEVDRSKLTMFDLIYYNPNDGERPPNSSEKLQMRLKPFEAEALANENKADIVESTGNAILDERLAEEEEMRMMEENPESEKNEDEKQPEKEDEEDEEEDAMPVPQVRLGPDGEIILDEKSLVIDTSETKRNKNQLANAPIIIENSSTMVNYGSWRKRRRAGRWSVKETARFYRALKMLGTNFSLMVKIFPGRDRTDLKRKFKSEEKSNSVLVDKIISQQIPFDPSQFLSESESEENSSGTEIACKGKQKKDTSKEAKGKTVRNNKALKKKVTIQEPKEHDSDIASIASIRSPYNKTSNEESEEDMPPPAKKKRNVKNAESGKSTRGQKTTSKSRTSKVNRRKKVQSFDSEDEESQHQTEEELNVTIPEPNQKDRETDLASAASKRSPKQTINEESVNLVPPSKKGRKVNITDSRASARGRKTAGGSGTSKINLKRVVRPYSKGDQSSEEENIGLQISSEKAQTPDQNSNNPLDNLLNSPLGQISIEQGGLTVVENSEASNQTPSFLVPSAFSEANPAFAQAEPGSLVFVSQPNTGDTNKQLVHVYRIAVPIDPVPL